MCVGRNVEFKVSIKDYSFAKVERATNVSLVELSFDGSLSDFPDSIQVRDVLIDI